MSSLFKKRKSLNTIRQRQFAEEEDEESKFAELLPKETAATKRKKKIKEKIDKTQSAVLSFGDELEADDGIIFQEKKSSLSYRLKKELKKERREKKKEEKERKNEGVKPQKNSVRELDELGIKIVNGREAEAIAHQPGDSDEEGPVQDYEEEGRHKFQAKPKPEQKSIDPWKQILESGKIPDANMIHLIRKKRQRAREMVDHIPIDDTVKLEQNKSRLIREDDNDRSDDESTRLEFSNIHDSTERKLRKQVFEAAQEEPEDENNIDWEAQQMSKSGAAAKTLLATEESYVPPVSENWKGPEEALIPGHSAALSQPTNYQAEGIIKRLRESRDSFEEVHRRHKMEYDNIIDDLVSSKMTITNCSGQLPSLSDNLQFYQDMKGYIGDLRDCLDNKIQDIRQLEQQVYLLYRQRTQKIVQRRRQDVKDQNNEVSPFASGKGAPQDEFRVRRAAEREGRRTRRRRERERKGDGKHYNGTSTDDELSHSETQIMQSELEKIYADAANIFEDVEEDFAELQNVIQRFEIWREIDLPTYCDAYVSYNLPLIFGPFIRLQLLSWNPLYTEGNNVDVERMIWFNTLVAFGVKNETSIDRIKSDPDKKLVSLIIEKIVIVKIKELVDCCWDPSSHSQTVRLVNLVRHYGKTYPTISGNTKSLKDLTKSIMTKIQDAIDNDVFIPMFPKTVYESKTSGVSLFFQRQFWLAWKLLSTVLMWNNVLSESVLHDLAIRSLLNLYLLPALNLASEINMADAIEKSRNVINALPRAWIKSDTNESHVFLKRFEAILVAFASKVDVSSSANLIKDICELLNSIGAKKQSEVVSNKYL